MRVGKSRHSTGGPVDARIAPTCPLYAPGMRERLRRMLGGAGRTLIVVGLLILGFVAYQLWGTGLITAREQRRLKIGRAHV